MNKFPAFRAKVGDEITLLQYILFYGLLFAVSPAIVVYNLFYMRRRSRHFGF